MSTPDVRMQILVGAFRELGQFLGIRFQALSDKIDALPKFDDARLLTALTKLASTVEKSQPMISVTQADLAPVLTSIAALKESMPKPSEPQDLSPLIARIETAIQGIQFQPTITVSAPDLTSVSKAIRESRPELPPLDLTPVLEAIKGLEKAIKKREEKPLKFDDMTLRAITASRGPVGGGSMLATKISPIVNLELADHEEEYDYTFPANTLSWIIKLRDQGTLLYYAFTDGKLPNSGDGLGYMTVPQNFLRSQAGVEWSGKTIYLGAETDDQIAEIEVYTL